MGLNGLDCVKWVLHGSMTKSTKRYMIKKGKCFLHSCWLHRVITQLHLERPKFESWLVDLSWSHPPLSDLASCQRTGLKNLKFNGSKKYYVAEPSSKQ